MPTSYYQNIPTIIELMLQASPNSVLDIGIGHGKYGLLTREYVKPVRLDGFEANAAYITDTIKDIYDDIYTEDIRNWQVAALKFYDLVLMIDVIEHMDKDDGMRLVRDFINSGSSVLISTPIEDYREPYAGLPFENHVDHYTIDDFKGLSGSNATNEFSTIVLLQPKA